MSVAEAIQSVETLLRQAVETLPFQRRHVTFLLGTDAGIQHEARVALTPSHLAKLRADLIGLGLEPEILVHAGAGVRAISDDHGEGFSDDEYADAGGTVVDPMQLANHGPLDVVHALKEPTEYESLLPGPFLRIGALHLASRPPGVCSMLAQKNFAGIFDGGTLGNCSYLRTGADRTPIVACMSRFAGAVSGRKVVEGLAKNGLSSGRILVVGGGVAGRSAISKLDPSNTDLVVVEIWPSAAEAVEQAAHKRGFRSVRVVDALTDGLFEDAIGIIFAHRSGAKAAEKVCHFRQVQKMRRGAAIADIAIDQGGSINHDAYDENDDANVARGKYKQLLKDFYYYAETNMPREEPYEASEMHGDASLPYIQLLLTLCAHHGSPAAVVQELMQLPARSFNHFEELGSQNLLQSFKQDLRNGLQITQKGGAIRILDPDIERDTALRSWVESCAG